MSVTRRRFFATALATAALLALPGLASANAHHQVGGVRRVGNGAEITVIMRPSGMYTHFNVGVTTNGGRYSRQEHGRSGTANGPTEVRLSIPYGGAYTSGARIRVISSWPAGGRTHCWGDGSDVLVTLP
jgi:hypothetical protein